MFVEVNKGFLYRKEPFGGIGFVKKTEDYLYLKPEVVNVLNFVKRKRRIKIETLCRKFKISQDEILQWIKIGVFNLLCIKKT